MPWLLLESSENVVILRIQFNFVLINVVKQIISTKNLCNLHKLVRVTVPVEEGLLSEDHGSEHGSQAPHVEAVIVLLEIDQEFWSLKIARGHANVVFSTGVIKLGQAPIDETQLKTVSKLYVRGVMPD